MEVRLLECDRYHHYYHYQSSAQYLWLAITLTILEQREEALAAYDKALFQDHFNTAALQGKISLPLDAPHYDKHPECDGEFCASVNRAVTLATTLHDQGVLTGNNQYFTDAIHTDPSHSNSYFSRGKYLFRKRQIEEAHSDFVKAIQSSHNDHNAYHQIASNAHFTRGEEFLHALEYDLAIAAFSKALDLYPQNHLAREARSRIYEMKYNSNEEYGFECIGHPIRHL